MSCEIYGRGNCTRSFHFLAEQASFDDVADSFKKRMWNVLCKRMERIKGEYITTDVIDIIEDY